MMQLGKLIWLVPVVAGLAAYWTSAARTDEESGNEVASRRVSSGSERGATRDLRRAEDFRQELARLEKRGREQSDHPLPLGFAEMSTEEMKAALLQLKDLLTASSKSENGENPNELRPMLQEALLALGRRAGAEELAWIEEEFPDERLTYIDGWADSKPEEVFDYVKRSSQPNPCSLETLVKLLNQRGEGGAAALRAGVNEVPWEWFRDNRDPFEDDFVGPKLELKEKDLSLWLESGAALELAKDGIRINQMFRTWAGENLQGALQAWVDWPDDGSRNTLGEFPLMLGYTSTRPKGPEAVTKVLSEMDSRSLDRIRETMVRVEKEYPDYYKRLTQRIPALGNLVNEPPPSPK